MMEGGLGTEGLQEGSDAHLRFHARERHLVLVAQRLHLVLALQLRRLQLLEARRARGLGGVLERLALLLQLLRELQHRHGGKDGSERAGRWVSAGARDAG